MTTHRERLQQALNHRQPDRVPIDFGSNAVTGMHVAAVTRLRRAVLKDDAWRVKVIEPYQMLGEMDPELLDALGIDVVGIMTRKNLFAFENRGWKPFRLFDGTEVLVPENFVTTPAPGGGLHIYPEGDTSVPASGHMPSTGWFFDTIIRQPPIDEDNLDPRDNLEEFGLLNDEDKAYYRRCAEELRASDRGVCLTMPGTAFGDIALVPAPFLKHPKGIRDITEWYVSTSIRQDYVHAVFEKQCEIGLKNIATLAEILGDRVDAVFFTGTDFGTQNDLFISPDAYRGLFKPYHKQVNDFFHQHTSWKTFIHSCGAVKRLIPEFIDAGFDILNPVQCSACGMDPRELKREFGKEITFWGGGVDTQKTMAFGTPAEVYREVRERIEIFGEGGGFVFDAVHNIQATTPTDNLVAMFQALKDSGR